MTRYSLLFLVLGALLFLSFLADLLWGSVPIAWEDCLAVLWRGDIDSPYYYLILHFRLPKALTALSAGAGIAVAGLQMQNLFHNPLADTSILGINSGAGLGVACYTMARSVLPLGGILTWLDGSWALVLSACVGAVLTLVLIVFISKTFKDLLSLLIVGVMLGFLASAVISVLQFFSDEEGLKSYLLWSFASLAGTSWTSLKIMLPLLGLGLLGASLMPKGMNALNLGETYARSVGMSVGRMRLMLIAITGLITGSITAFVGPIAFVGLAVPHFVRLSFRTADYRILIPATALVGATFLLCCDLVTQVPGQQFVLPINAITSVIGAPVVILALLGNKHSKG